MKATLQDKLEKVADEHAGEILDERLAAHAAHETRSAIYILGGIRTADRIASVVGSEAMRALIRFQDEERYKALGFATMVDFLNESELSPMSKNQFYDRKGLLEKEGDQVFNLLNDLGVSVRQRKLLGRGNVQIDGETALVTLGDEELAIELTDRTRLLETLIALADANADKSAKIEKQAEKIAKHDDEKRELYAEIDEVRASKAADVEQDAHAMAVVTLGLAFRELIRTVEEMTPVERRQFQSVDFERIAAWMSDLSMTFGRGSDWTTLMPDEEATPHSAPRTPHSADDDIIRRALDDTGDNDRELTDKL